MSDDEISLGSRTSRTNEFTCGECSRTFDKLPQLTRHHRDTHVKKFRCTKCDYRCGRKADMERHEGTHAEPIPARKQLKTPVYNPHARTPSKRSPPRRGRSRSPRTSSPRPSTSFARTPSRPRSPVFPDRRRSRSRSRRRSASKTHQSSRKGDDRHESSYQRQRSRSPTGVERGCQRSDAASQTEDEGDTRKRLKNLIRKLREDGHDGGSVIDTNTIRLRILMEWT